LIPRISNAKLTPDYVLPHQVCDEQRCEEQVFPLAINYMDRFLCICPIYRQQLQLLGTAALLLASKIRQCHALSVDLLCAYTDHSCTPDQIRVSTHFMGDFRAQTRTYQIKTTKLVWLGAKCNYYITISEIITQTNE
jgi:hypothetical protein